MDGARAVAAIAVVIDHLRNILFVDAPMGMPVPWKIFYFVTGFGHQAVMVFFVLSGYWIAKTVARRSEGTGFSWSDYGIDRLSRLWIVLIPALLLGCILDSIGRYGIAAPIYLGTQGTNTLTYDVATHLTFGNLVGSFAFLQTLLVDPFGSNGPLWSLANEFWYYVWFPLLFQVLRKRTPPAAASVVALTSMIVFRQLLPGFACWLFGALLFYSTRRTPERATRRMGAAAIGATGLLFLVVLGFSRLPDWQSIRACKTFQSVDASHSFST